MRAHHRFATPPHVAQQTKLIGWMAFRNEDPQCLKHVGHVSNTSLLNVYHMVSTRRTHAREYARPRPSQASAHL